MIYVRKTDPDSYRDGRKSGPDSYRGKTSVLEVFSVIMPCLLCLRQVFGWQAARLRRVLESDLSPIHFFAVNKIAECAFYYKKGMYR